MGFSSVTINAVRTGSSLLRIAPYYGTADVNSVQDENLILGLQFRGVGGHASIRLQSTTLECPTPCFMHTRSNSGWLNSWM